MVQERFHGPVETWVLVDVLREAKDIQHRERDTGVGKLRFRSSPVRELLAAPATVVVLRLKQVNERLLQSSVSRLAESTQHSSRRSCIAWVERSAWR